MPRLLCKVFSNQYFKRIHLLDLLKLALITGFYFFSMPDNILEIFHSFIFSYSLPETVLESSKYV